MKKALFPVAVVCIALGVATAVVPAQDGHRIDMKWGYVLFVGNEVIIRSTVNDPPKVRLEAARGSLGGVSFNMIRPDGKAEEVVLLQGKQDERSRNCSNRAPIYSGEMTIHIRDGLDTRGDGMKLVARLRHDSLWLLGMPPIEGDTPRC